MTTLEDRLKTVEKLLKDKETPVRTIVVRKDPKFPIFRADNKEISAEDWMNDVQEICLENEMSDQEKVTFLREHMHNAVFSEVRCRLRGDDYKNPDKILDIFERIYCSVISIDELNVSLYTRTQGKDETIQEYCRSILDLNQRIFRRDETQALNDGSLKAVFINGIYSDILKQHLKTTKCSGVTISIDDLRERAIEFERDQRKKEKNSSDGQKFKTVESKLLISKESCQDKILKKLEKIEEEISQLKLNQRTDLTTTAHLKSNIIPSTGGQRLQMKPANMTAYTTGRRCFTCNRSNHLAKDCWYNPRPRFSENYGQRNVRPHYGGRGQGVQWPSWRPSMPPPSQFQQNYPPIFESSLNPQTVAWNYGSPISYAPPEQASRIPYNHETCDAVVGYNNGTKPKVTQANCSFKSAKCDMSDNLLNKLVGEIKVSEVVINNVTIKGQLDSGSQVTIMNESAYHSICSVVPIIEIDGLLDIKSSTEHTLPYLGYIDIAMEIFGKRLPSVGVIITKDPKTTHAKENQIRCPILIGTNILDEFPEIYNTQQRQAALNELNGSKVKLCSKQTVILEPDQVLCIPVKINNFKLSCNGKFCIESGVQLNRSKQHLLPIIIPTLCNVKDGTMTVPIYNPNNFNLKLRPGQLVANAFVADVIPPENFSHLEEVEIEESASLEEKTQLGSLLKEFHTVFARNKVDFGFTNLLEHEINLISDKPIKQPYRRIPPSIFAEVRDHIQDLLTAEVIRPSSSPYASPIVVIRKKSGEIRVCCDYRRINAITQPDSFPLPRINEVVDVLKGCKYFTLIDMASGYTQVGVAEKDKHITAFCVPYGLFEYNRMPFGLSNSVATYSRLMTKIFSGDLFFGLLIYLDDLLIYSRTFTEHIQKLRLVLEKLQRFGLKLKPSKCQFLKKTIVYLGHKLSENGVEVDPSKFEAIENWKVPTTVKEVKSFLGFIGFYRRFIKDFSKIAAPLHELTKGELSKRKIDWNAKCQIAFDLLKTNILSKVVLSYVDFSEPFYLEVDACKDGLGAILSQNQDGVRRPIAFASRKLRKGEVPLTEFSSKRLEFLALKWAITEKFKEYFFFQKVYVITDSDPLSYLKTSKTLNSHDVRWAAQLDQFQYEIKYRSAKYNQAADAMSRIVYSSDEDLEEAISREPLSYSNQVKTDTNGDMQVLTFEQLKYYQHLDSNIQEFFYYLDSELSKDDWRTLNSTVKNMLKNREHFHFKKGLLYRKILITPLGEIFQYVVPSNLIKRILLLVHDHFGHQGTSRTFQIAQERYYWVGMKLDIEKHVRNCDRCTRAKSPPRQFITPMKSLEAARPLECIAIDYTLLEKSINGFENVLVITDVYSKFTQAVATPDQTALTTAKVLIREWFSKYGVPLKIHSDQGRSFENDLISQLCKLYNIKKTRTCPYTPRGNAQCERFNRTLHGLLRVLEQKQKRRWTAYLNEVTFIYNCTRHRTTGYSPFYLMFGRTPRTPLENKMQLEEKMPETTIKEFIAEHCQHLEQAYALADKKTRKEKLIRKSYYDRRARELRLTEGCLVYVKDYPKGRHKIQDRYKNIIYKVVRCYEDKNFYGITPADGSSNNIKVINRTELIECPIQMSDNEQVDLKYTSRESENTTSDESSSDEDCEYRLTERILIQPSHSDVESCQSSESDLESDQSSNSDDPSEPERRPLRRSSRINKGLHSNIHNVPRSVIKSD